VKIYGRCIDVKNKDSRDILVMRQLCLEKIYNNDLIIKTRKIYIKIYP